MTKYKLAEKFKSVQGEGYWVGAPMAFVRTSQCPVGKEPGICESWDGTKFPCDTGNARHNPGSPVEWHSYTEVNEALTAEELWDWCGHTNHLCLTGGEPLVYDLTDLIVARPGGKMLHIETSGTIFRNIPVHPSIWVTVSPKTLTHSFPLIHRADEVKLLVSKDTRSSQIKEWVNILDRPRRVFLQPIEDSSGELNRQRALELVDEFQLRISIQVHKLLQVR